MATSEVKQGPDPAAVASNVYKLVFENDRIRVFDVVFKPGAVAIMHGHPDHLVYVMNDATLKLSFPNGSVQEVPLKAGMALFLNAQTHEAENIGTTEAHNLVVELKG